MDRRAFLQTAAAAALATSLPEPSSAAPQSAATSPSAAHAPANAPYARAASTASPKYARAASTNKKTIGIQVGAVSFVDEGTEKVLDNFQQYADVNTLFLATFTYGRGIAGRQIPGQPLPDHGKQQYDTSTFTGGNYATIHPQYYKNTVFHGTRATELGSYDVLADVPAAARKRNIKTICWFEDAFRTDIPNVSAMQEIDLSGNHADTVCFNNPNYRNFLLGIVEDWSRSYDIDGIMWCSERQGAFSNALGAEQEGRDINPLPGHLLLSLLHSESESPRHQSRPRPSRLPRPRRFRPGRPQISAPRRRLLCRALASHAPLSRAPRLGDAMDRQPPRNLRRHLSPRQTN